MLGKASNEGTMNLIQPPVHDVFQTACDLLAQDKLVGIPTETVYGLAANAWSSAAVEKIFLAKGRPSNNPLIVHVASVERLSEAVKLPLPAMLQQQLDRVVDLWPGPITFVLPRCMKIPDRVTAGSDTVAVRIPAHPVARTLLERCPFPIAAPSANRSKYVSPTTAEHCLAGLGDHVELIIDGGPCELGVESTIVALQHDGPRLLRPGAVTAEVLASRFGMTIEQLTRSIAAAPRRLEAPGMIREHYSPITPLHLLTSDGCGQILPRTGRIAFRPLSPAESTRYEVVETLSTVGDLDEVARGLFAAVRRLDQLGLDQIVVDTCDSTGIGRAIMDRLRRAAAAHNPD